MFTSGSNQKVDLTADGMFHLEYLSPSPIQRIGVVSLSLVQIMSIEKCLTLF